MKIEISTKVREICPQLSLAILRCEVKNSVTSPMLWQEIESESEKIRNMFKIQKFSLFFRKSGHPVALSYESQNKIDQLVETEILQLTVCH